MESQSVRRRTPERASAANASGLGLLLDLAVGVGGILLFVSLFLNWTGNGVLGNVNAFQTFDFTTFVFVIVAAKMVTYSVLALSGTSPGARAHYLWLKRLVNPIAWFTLALVIYELLSVSQAHNAPLKIGIWLAFVAAILMVLEAVVPFVLRLTAAGTNGGGGSARREAPDSSLPTPPSPAAQTPPPPQTPPTSEGPPPTP